MHSRLRSLLLFCALLLGGWPAMLPAYAPAQPSQSLGLPDLPSSPSFILVASRTLADPRFRETVILVTRQGHSGPIGIVINRPQGITLDKVFPAHKSATGIRLFAGGPVDQKHISFLFRGQGQAAGTLKIAGHIHLSYDMKLLGELLGGARKHNGLLVVNGLAGWAPGQLENEIARGDWHILPVSDEILFERPADKLWQELFRRATATRK